MDTTLTADQESVSSIPEPAIKDDCVGSHIPEIESAHPDWAHDQVVAVALSKCGESNKSESESPADAEHAYYIGGAIKAIGDGVIGGYLVAYGSPNVRDDVGEW